MKDKGMIIFKITRAIVVIGAAAVAWAIFDGSFFRGFGDDELVISCIFYAVYLPSLLYFIGYILITRLPPALETDADPIWFRNLRIGAMSYPLLILACGVLNSVTRIATLFGSRNLLECFAFGAVVALVIMLIVPVIPTANMIIIIYLYRKNIRKKNRSCREAE